MPPSSIISYNNEKLAPRVGIEAQDTGRGYLKIGTKLYQGCAHANDMINGYPEASFVHAVR